MVKIFTVSLCLHCLPHHILLICKVAEPRLKSSRRILSRCHDTAPQDRDHIIAHGAQIADLGDLEVGVASHAWRVLVRCHLTERFALLEYLKVGTICEGAFFIADWFKNGDALVRVELFLQGHLGRRCLKLADECWIGSASASSNSTFLKRDGWGLCKNSAREMHILGHL